MSQLFYIGVKAVIIQKKRILLLKRINDIGQIYWDIPGGRLRRGEIPREGLRRELQEELNIKLNKQSPKLLGIYILPRLLKNKIGLFLLLYEVVTPEGKLKLSNEHLEYKWIKLRKLENQNIIEDGLKRVILQTVK